jgi:S-DNA-T family DNA segregation ATPase FtsK/SpoIIIE
MTGWIPEEALAGPIDGTTVDTYVSSAQALFLDLDHGRQSLQELVTKRRQGMADRRHKIDFLSRRLDYISAQLKALDAFTKTTMTTLGRVSAPYPRLGQTALTGAAAARLPAIFNIRSTDSEVPDLSPGINPEVASKVERACNEARSSITQARRKLFNRRLKYEAIASMAEAASFVKACRLQAQATKTERKSVDRRHRAAVEEAAEYETQIDAELTALAESIHVQVGLRQDDLETIRATLDFWLQPNWQRAAPPEWPAPTALSKIFVGSVTNLPWSTIEEYAGFGTDVQVPLVIDVRQFGGLQYLYRGSEERSAAQAAARSLMTRLLAGSPPGKSRLTIFDPLGLGQAAAPLLRLADFDPLLITGKVWSTREDLNERLNEGIAHIEMVTQKYLRGEFNNIDDFNERAGEIAEPYRFFFFFDFPHDFDDATYQKFLRIIENGPRCGVYTVTTVDTTESPPYGVDLDQLPRLPRPSTAGVVQWGGGSVLRFDLDADPLQVLGPDAGQAMIDQVVDKAGREGRGADNVTVDFERTMALYAATARSGVRSEIPSVGSAFDPADPASWWCESAADALVAPLGQSGARDVAVLRLDSEILSGGLLVGRPGSGKSTLLHTYIGGLATLYPPTELELYLVDFREGVEFKAYAEYGLPQARCVAIESEREFGLSVLEAIVGEMHRRGRLLRETGGEQTTFASFRRSGSEHLPRVLLVFDEFQVLFASDDAIGSKAAELLETIIRQGRGFGVHTLLSSQSLAGMDALGRHVLQLLPVRILLPSSENDAQTVLGEHNDAGKYLARRGEALHNPSGGAAEANTRFQTAFLSEEARLQRLDRLRKLGVSRGWQGRPVVFEGRGAAALDATPANDFVRSMVSGGPGLRLRVGNPVSLAGPIDLVLRREAAANVLVVHKGTHEIPNTLTMAAALSAVVASARTEIVDFTSVDDGLEDELVPLLERSLIRLTRRRRAPELLAEISSLVSDRIAVDDYRSAPVFLVLHGLHRARDLEPAGGLSMDGSEPDLGAMLEAILHDGPEVGVHTMLWVDTVGNLDRRLGRRSTRDCGLILAGPMGRDDSTALLDSDRASQCKDHQLIVVEEGGAPKRALAFGTPAPEWIKSVLHVSEVVT